MSKNQIEFSGDDSHALKYIIERGYASYSSIKNVRDCIVPKVWSTSYFDFGTEVHSRFLEHKRTKFMEIAEDEKAVKRACNNLADNAIVCSIMKGAKTEVKFDQDLWGLRVLGYIDILGADIGDLKTTRHTSPIAFANDMDFLQAALYLAVTGKRNFFYIGISKVAPYNIFVFNVNQFPERMAKANADLRRLIKYIKQKTKL